MNAAVRNEEDAATLRGLERLREGDYLAAHEYFETLWRAGTGPERELFRALAQLSAGHQQLSLGRAQAAARTWRKARTRLDALGLTAPKWNDACARFSARWGISELGPRLIDVASLPTSNTWPCPEACELLLRPDADSP